MIIFECAFFRELWWILVAKIVGEVLGGFEGEACGFPESGVVIRTV